MSLKQYVIGWMIKWFVVRLNIYILWSRFYQKLFQRRRAELPRITSLAELESLLGRSVWRKDRWYMAFDAVSHPEAAYNEFLRTGSLGDCEDYSSFSASILSKLGFNDVEILSVQWLDKGSTFRGHNVCVFKSESGYSFIGNWYNGHAVGNFQDIESMAKFIRGKDGILISWFTFPVDLNGITKSKVYKALELC